MPLTPLQQEVLAVIAANRSPASHLAGGVAINREATSPRFSHDLDIFHDHPGGQVAASAQADIESLTGKGYAVDAPQRLSAHHSVAVVRKGDDALRIEWTTDADFRFFPVQQDPLFGYCLHPADIATNKMLALAGREEVRDFLDILYLDEHYLSLGAVAWAAVGKDNGFTPDSILSYAGRHVRYREEQLATLHLAKSVSLVDLKARWLAAVEEARQLFERLFREGEQPGCLYLDATNRPVTPTPGQTTTDQLRRHFGSKGGASPGAG